MKMVFFNNSTGTRKRARRSVARRRKSRRRVVVRRKKTTARSFSTGASMARRRRKARSRTGARRRRSSRRRSVVLHRGFAVNPRGRRRRRGFRRNPFTSGGGGIVTTIKNGVKDGAVILAAQIATKKVMGLAQGVVPIGGLPGQVITGLGVPVIVTLIVRKVASNFARLASAAAFAEGLRTILASTSVGPFLADSADAGDQSSDLSAYPENRPANMGAYPGMGAYDDEAAA